MKTFLAICVAFLATSPAFAGDSGYSQGQGQEQGQMYQGQSGPDCDRDHHHGRHYRGHWIGNDRAIGPARGYYHMNARGASCEGARIFVGSRGAAILYYGDDLYQRVVRDSSFCSRDQRTMPFWADGCFLGYTCEENIGGIGGNGGSF